MLTAVKKNRIKKLRPLIFLDILVLLVVWTSGCWQ